MLLDHLLELSKGRMTAISTRIIPIFVLKDPVYLSTIELHIRSQKCEQLRNHKLSPYKVISKVDINSY
jgi:hypothetical protein